METQRAGLLGQGPFAVIGDMVPLPKRIELAAVEVVVVEERGLGFLHMARVGLDPGIGRFAEIARQADEREAVVPSDGNQRNHAASAAMIRHDNAPPFTRRRVNNAALMQSQASVIGLGAKGAAVVTPSDSP